jgi:peptidoglycan/LPS O-acetylase OafA/YrhL
VAEALARSRETESAASQHTWPTLDGIRGVMMIVVFTAHVSFASVPGAAVGVDTFFVLSGFLITALLVREFRKIGFVDLGRFYVRRALRLLPALVVGLAFTVLVALVFFPALRGNVVRSAASALFYFANFRAEHDPSSMPMTLHLWSLSVEEQFYVVWPISFVLLLRVPALRQARHLIAIALGTWVALVAWRWLAWELWADRESLAYRPDLRGVGLPLGCVLGLVLGFDLLPTSDRFRRWVRVAAALGAVFLAVYIAKREWWPETLYPFAIPVAGIAAGAVILAEVTFPTPLLTSFLGLRPMRWIGRVSYGIYIIHVPIIVLVADKMQRYERPTRIAVAAVLTVVGAALLRVVFERPFLAMKSRFSTVKEPTPATAGSVPSGEARTGEVGAL